MSDTLFCWRSSSFSRLVPVVSKFANVNLKITYLETLTQNDINRLVSKSPTGTLPVLKCGMFFLSGTVAITKYILSQNNEVNETLSGKTATKKASNEMWINFISMNILPIVEELLNQTTGNKQANEEIYSLALGDLMQELVKVDKFLTFKSFLVDNYVCLADVILAAVLHPVFSLVINQELRKNIPNVVRLFLFVSNLKELSSVLGKARLCMSSLKPPTNVQINLTVQPVTSQSTQEPKQDKPEKSKGKENKPVSKPTKEKENKPAQNSNKENQDNKASTTGMVQDDEDKAKSKKQHPLDMLPPSDFILDNFKKDFLNTKDKKAVMENFWKTFDTKGFSIWFLHYNKSSSQGKIKFMTCNLRGNYLEKLEKFRKYTFAAHGVYGVEPNLEVEGVWMWRGVDIPIDIQENDSFEYITFKKLDPSNENDRKFVESFWLTVNEGEIVNGRPVVDVEYFK